ncbi:MAG TPA: hypothetical protein VGM56_05035 [Byssovorax sp.]|jgi:hypothetical protein
MAKATTKKAHGKIAKKTLKKTPQKASPPAPADVQHTLTSLKAALGDATLDEATALLDGHDKPTLTKDGSAVVTDRITTDTSRNYGIAYDFLADATDDELDHLPVFSRERLRVAVWLAAEGQRRFDTLAAQKSGAATAQGQAAATAATLATQADAKRDQLHAALLSFAAGDKALLKAVATAYGSVSDLGAAVKAETALVRSWKKKGAAGVKQRVASSRMTDAWLDAADRVATSYASAAETAGATRTRSSVTQADVDYVDGMNLALHASIVAQFAAGHAADPGIPKLTYSSLLSHVHHVRQPPAPPAPAPAPPGDPPAAS